MLKKFLAASFGWKGMAAAVTIAVAVSATVSFAAGWRISSWKNSASELGKLETALSDQVEKMAEQNRISVAHLATLEQINTQARANSRRIGQYVEATNACRVSDADRRVFIGAAATSEN